jgi:hypothetical protein
MQTRTQTVILTALGLILQGCAAIQTTAPTSNAVRYSTDMVNKAPTCSFTAIDAVKDGAANAVTLTTGGGGWCGFGVRENGAPYTAGLLSKRARFGKVHVHTVGDDTRIDYTPYERTVVADSFTVRLIPGDATISVTVTPVAAGTK